MVRAKTAAQKLSMVISNEVACTYVSLWYCDQHRIPLPPGHRFPIAKYAMVREKLAADTRFRLSESPFVADSEIELAHDPGYVRSILDGSIDRRVMRRIGFPWSEQLVRRTLASVGGTLCAAERALASGVGGNLAGGTHHAFRGEGSGFCVFNDLAVTICSLRCRGAARRFAVVDLDVHQGDGTASIFAGNDDVLTLSVHGANNFPFRKQSSAIDIALRDGTGDEEYLQELQRVLPAVWDFRPDLLLYQSGVDGLSEDRLGRLALTHTGLMARDRLVFDAARRYGIPVVITLGGGYAEPVEATVEAHVNTCRTAAAAWLQV
jgi:acetoin utilization deacetylase AcuC-like enzyme